MKNSFYKTWRLLLPAIFIFILIHFIKDITQDILGINSFMDVFGDAKEDISNFSEPLKLLYIWAGVNTFFGEIFLLISIPIILKRKTFSKLELVSMIVFGYIIVFFVIATLLDPAILEYLSYFS